LLQRKKIEMNARRKRRDLGPIQPNIDHRPNSGGHRKKDDSRALLPNKKSSKPSTPTSFGENITCGIISHIASWEGLRISYLGVRKISLLFFNFMTPLPPNMF